VIPLVSFHNDIAKPYHSMYIVIFYECS